jgi:hypothetical protein
VRVAHRPAGIFLGSTGGPTNHLGHKILEARFADAVMGLVDQRISIQGWVDHNAIDEIVDHGGDGVDAAKAVIERRLGVLGAHPRFS